MKTNLIYITCILLTAFIFFIIGQDNPPAKPLPSIATITCPFGSEYTLARGSDATVTVKCIIK